MNNFYTLLGLDATASLDDIKKAIHREQRLWANRTNAPDLQRKQEAERRVTLLDEAEAILLDPGKRAAYDRDLKAQESARPSPAGPEIAGIDNPVQEALRLLESGRVGDALYLAQDATEANPRESEAWWVLGRASHQYGDTERAIQSLKRAISIRPNQPKYLFDLGNIFEAVQDWPSAAECYLKAQKVEPSVLMYRAAYGAVLVNMGQSAAGIEILEQCVEREPDNAAYQWFLAIGYADSAQVGWTKVGEGHRLLEPGEYATSFEQVTVAQTALEKALALKFDDQELTKQLTEVKSDLDAMTKRRFVGNWAVPGIYGAIGLLGGMSAGSHGMLLMVLFAALYVASTYVPQYIINRQLVKGKKFNDFSFLGRIAELGTDSGELWAVALSFVAIMVISMMALPFFAVFNLYRYQGDTIRRWLTSAENKERFSVLMGKLQSAASGTATATVNALANVKSSIERPKTVEDQQTESRHAEAEQAVGAPADPPLTTAPLNVEPEAVPRAQTGNQPLMPQAVLPESLPTPVEPAREALPTGQTTSQAAAPRSPPSVATAQMPQTAVAGESVSKAPPARPRAVVLANVGGKRLAFGATIVVAVVAVTFGVVHFVSRKSSIPGEPNAAATVNQADKSVASALENARKCLASGDTACAKAIADSVLAQNPTNAEALQIRERTSAADQTTKAANSLQAGQRCLAAGDLKCARDFAAQVLGADSSNVAARKLLQEVESAERDSKISSLLARAEDCLVKGDAACAGASTNDVLGIDPSNARALDIMHRLSLGSVAASTTDSRGAITDGRSQPSGASATVVPASSSRPALNVDPPAATAGASMVAKKPESMTNRLGTLAAANLSEGQTCLKAKNFECAIARAETVLQLDPRNQKAVALRDDARAAQKQAFEESELK